MEEKGDENAVKARVMRQVKTAVPRTTAAAAAEECARNRLVH